VTRRIGAIEGGNEVKIAILSAFAFTEYREQALRAGIDDFVSKPFRAEEIFDCLARHLGVHYRYEGTATEKATGTWLRTARELARRTQKELADAVITLDSERITAVIGRIARENTALGGTLAQYAARYAYSAILQGLRLKETMTVSNKGRVIEAKSRWELNLVIRPGAASLRNRLKHDFGGELKLTRRSAPGCIVANGRRNYSKITL
jgi:CheY-like chemotaxis protein